ncbi:NUDIX hydrolase [Paraburkholderia sp. A2RO-4L]|uniref:NUDIX hydrolase n=1 Tax=Paraburkholderia sp. A2RO-4L TaxID=3028374 RepID=UPI0032FBBF88|nr:NUDIX hydrolase [Burkholderia vietnamiensis]
MKDHVIKTYFAEPAQPVCLHENRFFRLMFNGEYHYLEALKYPRSAIVVPRFANGDLMLVKLKRAPAIGLSWEFPRGGLLQGECPTEGGVRALEEETGYRIDPLGVCHLGRLAPDTATINGTADVLLVDIPDDAARGAFDSKEIVEPLRVPEHEFRGHILSGDIVDGQTIAAYALLLLHKRTLN